MTWRMKLSVIAAGFLVPSGVMAYTYTVDQGWNLLGAVEDISDLSVFQSEGGPIWLYDQENGWSKINPTVGGSVSQGKGFWIRSVKAASVDVGSSTSSSSSSSVSAEKTYKIVDTGQSDCYDSNGVNVSCSGSGQDGAYSGNSMSYTDNGDLTITDNITELMWTKSADINGDGTINVSDKKSQSDASSYCSSLNLAGYSDWRLPDIKTLYSLMNFKGGDPSNYLSADTSGLTPFIDDAYFDMGYGDSSAGERIIDAQWATTSIYVDYVFDGVGAMFGLNLADGRIKGYPYLTDKTFYVYCVRGNESYGVNNFVDNDDGTVSDSATGLMWEKDDSGSGMDWDSAISRCENATTAGYSDWRLPNIKELHSLTDYSNAPSYNGKPALDTTYFNATEFNNEEGNADYGYYWSSTTHATYDGDGSSAAYISFGRAIGCMDGMDACTSASNSDSWLDVHGAGCQRSDSKTVLSTSHLSGSYYAVPTADGGYGISHGPQGDAVRSANYVRCVRDVE